MLCTLWEVKSKVTKAEMQKHRNADMQKCRNARQCAATIRDAMTTGTSLNVHSKT